MLRAKRLIRDLHRQVRRFEQLVVFQIGLDQSALNAAFKDAGKHQTQSDGHISRQQPDPVDFRDIRIGISQRQRKRDQRQAEIDPAVRQTAFDQHQDHRGSRTEHFPPDDNIITRCIAMFLIAHHAVRKGKDPLVRVVCQHQQKQNTCRDIQRPRPTRQPAVLRSSQRQGNQQGEHRNKKQRQVISVP